MRTLSKKLQVLYEYEQKKSSVHEGLFNKPEKSEIKNLREKKKDTYLFHGTDLRKRTLIEKEGLKPSKAEDYYKGMEEFQPGGSLFGKDVTWLTSYEKYAKLFSTRSKRWILDLKQYMPLIVKINGSKLRFLDNTGSEDEYVTEFKIPSRDIVWPDSSEYEEIKKKEKYLT